MSELKKYDARKGLGDFDPTAEREYQPQTNALPKDGVVIFVEHPQRKQGTWVGKTCDIVVTDTGIECHAPYVASCVINKPEAFLNKDMDEKYHCVHTARTGAAIEVKPLMSAIQEDGTFPKVKIVETLPVALDRKVLIERATEDTKTMYADYFGVKLEEMKCDFVPSIKKSKYNTKDGVFSVKLSVVELVN